MHISNFTLQRGLPACMAWALLALPTAWGQAEPAAFSMDKDCQRTPPPFPYVPCPNLDTMKAPATQPSTPSTTTPPTTQPETPMTQSPFALGQGAALGGGFAMSDAASYIDSAIPRTTFRLRFDAAYDDTRPDRAEFFYGKCGCFRVAGIDPKAPGPALTETNVDYQDVSAYFEYAPTSDFSVFGEVPWRFLNPQQNNNTNGLADINAGFKVALIRNECQVLTFQLRGYFSTGDADRGLGTNHESVEPALLYYQRLSDRLVLDSEVRYWVSTAGTDFSGSVIRYGAGLSYDLARGCDWKLTPVAELVGWTVLSGKESDGLGLTHNSGGETIVNAKLGARFFFGDHSSIGASYGRALTGTVWYKDIARLEYRWQY